MCPDRRGFILPTTLMVMTLLTVMLTAAFIMISAEYRSTDNAQAQSRAHALAEAGLEDYLTRNRGFSLSTTYDSIRINYTSGYADVVGSRLVALAGSRMPTWIIRSTGVLSGNTLTGTSQAQRVVAQLATLSAGILPVKGAFVSANPIVFLGPAFLAPPISGNDACGANLDTVALTHSSFPGDIQGSWGGMGVPRTFSRSAILDSTHIDWASLLAGNFSPDFTVTPWPSSWTGYPTFYAPGDLTLTGGHVGILVVRGNLTIQIGASWSGIIIVGGRVVGPLLSIATIEGAMVSGLNNLITPNSVGPDSIQRALAGNPLVRWNSCEVAAAVSWMGGMSAMKHTFIDTWALY